MRKFLWVTSVVVLAFALSGAAVGSQKVAANKAAARTEAKPRMKANMRTARGEITAVDLSAGTLTLSVQGKAITFAYNNQTKFTESGRTVQPSAITNGMMATVKYTEREGKNWAHSVYVRPAHRAVVHPAKKSKS